MTSQSNSLESVSVGRYKHEALNRSTSSIRLITVQPDTGDGLLRCRIRNTLIDVHRYTALSYECGSAAETETIFVDNKPFPVRHNVFNLLKSVRDVAANEFIWIDTICIDSENTPERNHQVQQMGKIYLGAARVFIYLGAGSTSTDGFLDAVQKTDDARLLQDKTADIEQGMRPFMESALENGNDYLEALASLCSEGYWRRRWVIQEIVLNHRRYILCGQKVLHWTPFKHCVSACKAVGDHPALTRINDSSAASLLQSLSIMTEQPEKLYAIGHIATLLERFRGTKCERTHDRVYALLSLAHGGDQHVVEYGTSVEELYHQIISSGGSELFTLSRLLMSSLDLSLDMLVAASLPGRLRELVPPNIHGQVLGRVFENPVKASSSHLSETEHLIFEGFSKIARASHRRFEASEMEALFARCSCLRAGMRDSSDFIFGYIDRAESRDFTKQLSPMGHLVYLSTLGHIFLVQNYRTPKLCAFIGRIEAGSWLPRGPGKGLKVHSLSCRRNLPLKEANIWGEDLSIQFTWGTFYSLLQDDQN